MRGPSVTPATLRALQILCCFEEVRLLEAKGECAVHFSWILSRERRIAGNADARSLTASWRSGKAKRTPIK